MARSSTTFRKGQIPWNKGVVGRKSNHPPWNLGIPRTAESRRKASLALKGRPKSEEHKQRIREAMKGRCPKKPFLKGHEPFGRAKFGHITTDETKAKLSFIHGSKKGWITPINKAIRVSRKYRAWRKSVFERDDYTCQLCGKRGGVELAVDHIKPFALYPELRFDMSNARTLCRPCHIKTDTFGHKTRSLVRINNQ